MKDALEYFKLANSSEHAQRRAVSARLITNFTDGTLQKIFTGVCAEAGLALKLSAMPYKQYHLLLKSPPAEKADITFIFFDVNQYMSSALSANETHVAEVLADIERLSAAHHSPVVVTTFPLPYESAYGNLFEADPLFKRIKNANEALRELGLRTPNLYVCDIERVLRRHGELRARDFRGLYSFDIPFTNDFFVALSHEWLGYLRASLGLSKKCLVVDLDNMLWGGIVGEAGPQAIELGPEYPGVAYQNFQRALLSLYERGIILVINSRNNPADVDEVFKTNPHMLLKPEHFAATRINWENKAENILELAKELNIGTDAMVFIDDDAMNRDLVRAQLPEVSVPEWALPPEQYVPALFALTEFYQLRLTDEDRKKGEMYAQEKQRTAVRESVTNIDDYIAALTIAVRMHINEPALIPRLSQMSLKTNQFNLTTKRYGEKELADLAAGGALLCAADVSDKFGEYGTTIFAIVLPHGAEAQLDIFLMSCRVMGRGVEQTFLNNIIEVLKEKGVTALNAQFIPTPKNEPAKEFLPKAGFSKQADGTYRLDIVS